MRDCIKIWFVAVVRHESDSLESLRRMLFMPVFRDRGFYSHGGHQLLQLLLTPFYNLPATLLGAQLASGIFPNLVRMVVTRVSGIDNLFNPCQNIGSHEIDLVQENPSLPSERDQLAAVVRRAGSALRHARLAMREPPERSRHPSSTVLLHLAFVRLSPSANNHVSSGAVLPPFKRSRNVPAFKNVSTIR
jgi:hypothetical protein